MKFAINYSEPAADLQATGILQVDYFKCPAWPDVVNKAQQQLPCYVHLPLIVSQGDGRVIDSEEKRPTDWKRFLPMLDLTQSPYINIHLLTKASDYPFIPLNSTNQYHIEQVTENLIHDVTAVCKRFGAENVIVENIYDDAETNLRIGLLPQVIQTVVQETGAGLLLDLAHAYLAAVFLGVDAQEYTNALPIDHIRELHIAGIQPITGRWLEIFSAHFDAQYVEKHYKNRMMDHLPLCDNDWQFIGWALSQIHNGRWAEPWIVALEYGGVGPFWEDLTEKEVLIDQVPRVQKMVKPTQQTLVNQL